MKFKKIFFKDIYFLFLICINLYINCIQENPENNNELINYIHSSNFSPYPSFLNDILINNLQMTSDFDPEIHNRIIMLNDVQSELIFKEKIYVFNFNQNDNKNEDYEDYYLIHFYPLDCHIKIAIENNKNNADIIKINNYEYDAFSVKIHKDDLEEVNIKLKTLITSNDEYNKNRTFHLMINSFQNNDESKLNIKENEPTFLYFNNNLKKIKLFYEINTELTNPIFVSFFIKERVKFKVEIEKTEINKTISYIDGILISKEEISRLSNVTIIIKILEEEKDAVLISKIEQNYSIPQYLQKNILNLEFIASKISYQYFYMEIFKGEEGQIYLNNKKFEGLLIGKIIEKGIIAESQIINNTDYFPTVKNNISYLNDIDFLKYYEYEMKLSFNSSQTSKCEEGCYLLITYFSKSLYSKNTTYIKGGEYTLLVRIWDEEEYNPQIINIPLNEYIFGTFSNDTIYYHYYSVFIPDKTNNVIIEIQKNTQLIGDIDFFSKKGIVKINHDKYTENTICLNNYIQEDNYDKILINLSELIDFNNFEEKYVSFKFINIIDFSSYYFRILQKKPEDNFMIYPLNINRPNLCNATSINEDNGKYSCFFLIHNEYSEIGDEFIVYGYGHKKVQHISWLLFENDYNSIDFNNINNLNNFSSDDSYLNINTTNLVKPNFILIKLESTEPEILTIITNYYLKLINTYSIQIYSYKMFSISNYHIFFNFNFDLYDKFRLILNNTDGTGEICFNKYCKNSNRNDNKIRISPRNIISFLITKDIKKIDISTSNILIFNIKMDYIIDDGILTEINYNQDFRGSENDFLVGYYLKEVESNGVDINFHFKYNLSENTLNENFIIFGYIVDYDIIKLINKIKSIDYFITLKEPDSLGKFDKRTNNGLIRFNKEDNNNDFSVRDKYYFIVIDNIYELFPCSLEIHSTSIDSPLSLLPINKYISGSFNLKRNKTQSVKYFIRHSNKKEDFILEFSSNYRNIKLSCESDTIKCQKIQTEGGNKKYNISIDNNDNYTEAYFEVKLNDSINEKNVIELEDVNYIIKYYDNNQEKKYKFFLSHTLEKIEEKDKNITYNLQIKNKEKNIDFNEGYEFVYILNVYEKDRILKDELLNTTALINTKEIYQIYKYSNTSLDSINFDLKYLKHKEDYIVSLFIKILENGEHKYYYTYNFEINKKEQNNLIIYLIVGFSILIIILLIAFIFIIRYVKRKNKALTEQIQALSFSSGMKEDIITKELNKSKEDEDYEKTFI